jgi:hypothetical protein
MLLGWVGQQAVKAFYIEIPDLSEALNLFGTIGLVLIVLEGTLELEIERKSLGTIKKSLLMSIVPLFLLAAGISYAFYYFLHTDMRTGLINAIPFCIISSAIAIPSVRALSNYHKNFITYESSLSDIVGVIMFNFIALNTAFTASTFVYFLLEMVIITVISIVSTLFLAFLLGRLNHHVKFGPILIMVILIYSITKLFHLPGLIFIVVLGLAMGNVKKISELFPIQSLKPEKLAKEVHFFKDLVTEATFLIRSIFFLLFGFLVQTQEVLNQSTILWSAGIVCGILLIRVISLKVLNLKLFPLMFIAPRGLITILLFLSIAPEERISIVNNSLIVQVILLSVLLMMIGVIFSRGGVKGNDLSGADNDSIPLS